MKKLNYNIRGFISIFWLAVIVSFLGALFFIGWYLKPVILPFIPPANTDSNWQSRTPQQAHLDIAKLKEVRNYLGGRGFIARNGYQVYAWGDYTKNGNIASSVKPFYSHFLFLAVEEGLLDSVDEKVVNFESCLSNINASLDFKDRHITFRHMANQTSVYQLQEHPGTAYAYNDWQMALFLDTLILKVYNLPNWRSVDKQFFIPKISSALQMEDSPTMLQFGVKDRPGRIAISPRDHARFGLLYLRNGRWQNQQIISAAHVKMAVTSPLPRSLPRTTGQLAEMCQNQRSLGSKKIPDNYIHHHNSYSWLWWVNGMRDSGLRFWPDAPTDVFATLGHKHGRRGMAVIPGLDIVIAWNDTLLHTKPWDNQNTDPHPLNNVFKLLVEADTSPDQIKGSMADDNHL